MGFMGRRLYWQDSYGYVHRDRKAEKKTRSHMSMKPVIVPLLVLAALLVAASVLGS